MRPSSWGMVRHEATLLVRHQVESAVGPGMNTLSDPALDSGEDAVGNQL